MLSHRIYIYAHKYSDRVLKLNSRAQMGIALHLSPRPYLEESKAGKTALSRRGSHIIVQSSKCTSTPLTFTRCARQCAVYLEKDSDIGVQITVTVLDGCSWSTRLKVHRHSRLNTVLSTSSALSRLAQGWVNHPCTFQWLFPY